MPLSKIIERAEIDNYHKIERILTRFKLKSLTYTQAIDCINSLCSDTTTQAIQEAFKEIEVVTKLAGSLPSEKEWDIYEGYCHSIDQIESKKQEFLSN